jgi:SAM-dependent methyltransferase
MCHIGLDSLSWARKGAQIVGVDFSEEAVLAATKLSEQTGLKDRAKFIRSDVYEARKNLGTQEFDIVFTSYGILCWLPDLTKWAKVISSCLKPGGIFYIAESHPFGQSLQEETSSEMKEEGQKVELIMKRDYFSSQPTEETSDWTYAGLQLAKTCKMFEWVHSMGDIINAIADAGLTVTFVHEFPWECYQRFPSMRQKEPRGPWFLPEGVPKTPMTFSLMAKKPL